MQKDISKIGIIALAVGAIIGWGAFVLPGELFIKEIGVLNSIIGLFCGAILMIIIEKSYQYMYNKHIISGGEFLYAYKVFGKKIGFITGWFLMLAYLSIIPLNGTAIVLIVEKIFGNVLKFWFLYEIAGYPIYLPEVITSSVILIFFAYFNIKGLKYSIRVQNIMVIILVVIVIGMGAYGLFFAQINKEILYLQLIDFKNVDIKSILKVICLSPWAYMGFDTIVQVLDKNNFSKKNISLLSSFSILLGFIIYSILILLTAIKFNFIMLQKISLAWATGDAIVYIFGDKGLLLLGICLLMAITAGINSFFIATIKLSENMLKVEIFSKKIVYNSKQKKKIILLITLLSIIMPWFGRKVLLWVTDVASVGATITYMFACLSATKLAYIFKDTLNFIAGIFGSLLSFILGLVLLIPNFAFSLSKFSYFILFSWILIGILLFSLIENNRNTDGT